MKPFKIFLAFTAALLLTAQAHAMRWYSASTGRWLSRDPIEEKGGANLYNFVSNDGINSYDLLGLYKKKGRTITVDKCEIVIYYGHGGKKGINFIFPSPCSAGGLIACYPGSTNPKIPAANQIPGSPTHGDYTYWESGGPLDTISQNVKNKLQEDDPPAYHEGNSELAIVVINSYKKAKDLCNGCCEKIKISFIRNASSNPFDQDNDKIPTLTNVEFDCKTKSFHPVK